MTQGRRRSVTNRLLDDRHLGACGPHTAQDEANRKINKEAQSERLCA
jgi:hypothetical protein